MWGPLVQLLKRRSGWQDDDARRRLMLRKAAQLEAEKLQDSEQAFTDLLGVFEETYDDELGPELAGLAERVDGWSKLLERYAYCASVCPQAEGASKLYARLASWRLYHEDSMGALRAYEQALHHDPRKEDVRAALEELCRITGQIDCLLASYQWRAEHAGGSTARSPWLLKIGELHARQGSLQDAREILQAALVSSPDDQAVLGLLEETLGRMGEVGPLLDVRRRLTSVASGDVKGAVAFRLGTQLVEQSGDAEEIAKAFAVAVEHGAGYEAMTRLADAYETLLKVSDASQLLEKAAAAAPTTVQRAECLYRAFYLIEPDGDLERAVDLFCEAASLEKRPLAPVSELLTVFDSQGVWSEVVTCLLEAPPAHDIDYLGQLLGRLVAPSASAEKAWRELLELPKATEALFSRCEGRLTRFERWDALDHLYSAWRERFPESSEGVLLRAAALQDEHEFGDPVVIWRRLAEALDPPIEAVFQLWARSESSVERAELGEVLLGRLPRRSERRLAVLRYMAQHELDRSEVARLWQEILLFCPDDLGAMAALIEVAVQRADFDAVRSLMERRFDAATVGADIEEATNAWALFEAERGRAHASDEVYLRGLERCKTDTLRQARLEGLLKQGRLDTWAQASVEA